MRIMDAVRFSIYKSLKSKPGKILNVINGDNGDLHSLPPAEKQDTLVHQHTAAGDSSRGYPDKSRLNNRICPPLRAL